MLASPSVFLERFVKITGLLGVRERAGDPALEAALACNDVEEAVRRLLGLDWLRAAPRVVSAVREAATGEAMDCDARGSVRRVVSPGGVPFFVAEAAGRQVQVGVPSESIKNFVREGLPVPRLYVLPASEGATYGDIEFPLFWNFFIEEASANPKARVVVAGKAEQLERARRVFHESMFGPPLDELCVRDDIDPAARAAGYDVDFVAEQGALSGGISSVDDFAVFVAFDEEGWAVLEEGAVRVRMVHGALLEVWAEEEEDHKKKLVAALDLSALAEARAEEEEQREVESMAGLQLVPDVFCSPSFGITFIGTSHGFDGHGHTTGFILWIASRGVLVDPPVGTGEFLHRNRIPPTLLRDVILTHVHADHDAGLLPFLLRHPHRVTLHAFRSVHEAFQRKLRLKRVSAASELYHWNPLLARRPAKLYGAQIDCDFSLHTLPTMRFTVRFGGRSLAYSADTFFEPARLAALGASGVLCPARLAALLEFPLRPNIDLLVHEAGVPPIHTPLSALEALPESVRSRLLVVHCASLPAECSLRIPRCGMDETLVLSLEQPHEGLALSARLSSLVLASPLFERLSGRALLELTAQMQLVAFARGDVMMRRGDVDHDRLLMLVDGVAMVSGLEEHASRQVAAGAVSGSPEFPASLWPPVPVRGRISALCRANLELLTPEAGLLSVATSGAVLGLSRLLPLPPPRNASVVATSDLCVCASWTGAEVRRALEESGCLEKAAKLAASALTHQSFLQHHLSKSSLLGSLPSNLIEAMAGLVESDTVYEPGRMVFQQGCQSRGLHVVKTGAVLVYVKQGEVPLLVARIEVGEVFGEMSLFSSSRNATVVASEIGCEVLTIGAFGMTLLMNVPAVRSAVLSRATRNRSRLELLKLVN